MQKALAPSPAYFGWLDGLRGIAALCVVVFHYHHFYLVDWQDRPNIPKPDQFPFSGVLLPVYEHGGYAVQLFWVISGFVFAHVYFRRRSSLPGFIMARFARLYPLHFATLVIVALLQWLSMFEVGHWQIYGNNDAQHFALQLIFSSNWSTLSRGLSFNGPIWSVSLEIMAYFLFYFSLPALRKYPFYGAISFSIIGFIFNVYWPTQIPLVSNAVAPCIGYFFIGTAVYAATYNGGNKYEIRNIIFGVSIVALAAGYLIHQQELLVAAGSVILVSLAIRLDAVGFRTPTPLAFLGRTSYSIYLVHVPLQMGALIFADVVLGGTRSFAQSAWLMPIYITAALAIAQMSYKWLERPANAFLHSRIKRPAQRIHD